MGESICIIGAGITGLACAYKLAPKHNVTIVARDMPGDLGNMWASPWCVVLYSQSEGTVTVPVMLRENVGQEPFSTHSLRQPSANKGCKEPLSSSIGTWRTRTLLV